MELPAMPPVLPVLAKLAREVPDGSGWIFEPKWDGLRCIVFRDGPELLLASRKARPFDRYFPELREPLLEALPDRCVVDGEIVVADLDGGGLDFDALQQRIHPAESRVKMLAEATPSGPASWVRIAFSGSCGSAWWSSGAVVAVVGLMVRVRMISPVNELVDPRPRNTVGAGHLRR